MTLQEVRAWAREVSGSAVQARITLAAGGLAYFVALALAPAALALGAIVGLLLTPQQVHSVLDSVVTRLPQLASIGPVVQGLVSTIATASSTSVTIATVVSLVLAVWAASNVAVGVRMALAPLYGTVTVRGGFVPRVMAAVATFVVLVVAAALVVLAAVLPQVLAFFHVDVTWLLDSPVAAVVVLTALVVLVARRVMRRAGGLARGWRSPGPPLAAVWILVVTLGVGIFVRLSTSLTAATAIFGSLIVVLLWLYLSFLGLLVAAVVDAQAGAPAAMPTPRF